MYAEGLLSDGLLQVGGCFLLNQPPKIAPGGGMDVDGDGGRSPGAALPPWTPPGSLPPAAAARWGWRDGNACPAGGTGLQNPPRF